MNENGRTSLWQLVGGGVIICAAFAIMMPDLLRYLFGLWRLIFFCLLIVFLAGGVAWLQTRRQRAAIKAEREKAPAQTTAVEQMPPETLNPENLASPTE